MSKPEWGEKRECPECGARFYDLDRDPIVCPKCGAPYVVTVAKTAGAATGGGAESTSAGSAEATGPEGEAGDAGKLSDVNVDGDEDEDDDLIEDAAELVEEGDDVSDVLDGAVDDGKTDE